VVGDDAHGEALGRVRLVVPVGELRREQNDVFEEVGLVVRLHALQDGGGAFEPHARIDGGRGQGFEHVFAGLGLLAVVLHEDQIPKLDGRVAGAVDVFGAVELGVFRVLAEVVVDLRVGAAGAGLGHLPEVVLAAEAEDALGARADLLPQRDGLLVGRHFVVAREDREPKALRVELQFVDQEVPGEADRVLLEVVAEGEVAEHLEEGVVARGLADLVEVVVLAARAQALLRSDGAIVVALLRAEEHVLELVHPGVGEEQRRVVDGQERARRHAPVAVPLEVAEKLFA
jgi:hypothetical protein